MNADSTTPGAGDAIARLASSIRADPRTRHLAATPLPNRRAVIDALHDLLALVYPGFFGDRELDEDRLEDHLRELVARIRTRLSEPIRVAMRYARSVAPGRPNLDKESKACDAAARAALDGFFERLPEVRSLLALDVQAAYDGDPAARHTDEVVLAYPGLFALTTYRLVHELLKLGVPLVPRIMSEHAHAETGIDIHPGARIGEAFFIDHGTGVVIGETSIVGHHCRLYQGVTLGVKHFERDEEGKLVRGTKRHPTLGDHVVVFAGAMILGGETVVGDHCVINGGVVLTQSVPAGHVVRRKRQDLKLRRNVEMSDEAAGDPSPVEIPEIIVEPRTTGAAIQDAT